MVWAQPYPSTRTLWEKHIVRPLGGTPPEGTPNPTTWFNPYKYIKIYIYIYIMYFFVFPFLLFLFVVALLYALYTSGSPKEPDLPTRPSGDPQNGSPLLDSATPMVWIMVWKPQVDLLLGSAQRCGHVLNRHPKTQTRAGHVATEARDQ